jgi:hypothetical protein
LIAIVRTFASPARSIFARVCFGTLVDIITLDPVRPDWRVVDNSLIDDAGNCYGIWEIRSLPYEEVSGQHARYDRFTERIEKRLELTN